VSSMIGPYFLIMILAALVGGALGCLLTIGSYNRAARQRMAYEGELAQAQDVLTAMALLRRVRAGRHQGSCSRDG
jgi:hypothetical protein